MGRKKINDLSNRGSLLGLSETESVTIERGQNETKSQQFEPEENPCFVCGDYKQDIVFCNQCHLSYCSADWEKQAVHFPQARQAPGAVLHEKTDPILSWKIEGALRPARTKKEEEAYLHKRDETAMWFGVLQRSDEIKFFDAGQYDNLLARYTPKKRSDLYPGLVSFVGNTNSGKSSLINLLVSLGYKEKHNDEYMKPVVGAVAGPNRPTSSNVHLYQDPYSSKTNHPIFYADSEGIEAGDVEPRSQHFLIQNLKTVSRVSHSVWNTGRSLLFLRNDETPSRHFLVTNLFSRILYLFSDVVVFVLENPKTIEKESERLLEWGSNAFGYSTNQAVRPHAIIALNKAESPESPEPSGWWDANESKKWLFEGLNEKVQKNPKFEQYATRMKAHNLNLDRLLEQFYSSVTVIRIPAQHKGLGRQNAIKEQMTKLYRQIEEDCDNVRDHKRRIRLLLNADQIGPYLQLAFDHLSSPNGLSEPFDFIKASFKLSPISADFAGNLKTLGILLTERVRRQDLNSSKRPSLSSVVRKIGHIAASAVMLNVVRNSLLGDTDLLMSQYKENLTQGIESLLDHYWPCEMQYCCIVKVSHKSIHQNRDGREVHGGAGIPQEYHCEESSQNMLDMFLKTVATKLSELLSMNQGQEKNLPDSVTAKSNYRNEIKEFYNENKTAFYKETGFFDNRGCLCCLMGLAEICLSCEHILCSKCVEDFCLESPAGNGDCPLHNQPLAMRPKLSSIPVGAGLRVLSLDGGGVRGIMQLVILQRLERHLGGEIPIQSLLDLTIGTSIGGTIASGLIANGWTTGTCIAKIKMLCKQAFTPRSYVGTFDSYTFGYLRGLYNLYETGPLELALKEAFGPENRLFGGPETANRKFHTKLALPTSSTSGGVFVFGSYNRIDDDKTPAGYNFLRKQSPKEEVKVWEAVRATSAAPTWFKSFRITSWGKEFVDGGLYHNNPINIAEQELNLIWPKSRADIMISIGTGIVDHQDKRNAKSAAEFAEEAKKFPWWQYWRRSPLYALAKIAIDHVENSLNSQRTWDTYLNSKGEEDKKRRFRLNTTLEKLPNLDDTSQIDYLQRQADKYWDDPKRETLLRSVAHCLLATLFYFDLNKTEETDAGNFVISGRILCRFNSTSYTDKLSHLGNLFSQLRSAQSSNGQQFPYFKVEEKGKPQYEKYQITQDVIANLQRSLEFSLPDEMKKKNLSHTKAVVDIRFCFGREEEYSISGFPRLFKSGN